MLCKRKAIQAAFAFSWGVFFLFAARITSSSQGDSAIRINCERYKKEALRIMKILNIPVRANFSKDTIPEYAVSFRMTDDAGTLGLPITSDSNVVYKRIVTWLSPRTYSYLLLNDSTRKFQYAVGVLLHEWVHILQHPDSSIVTTGTLADYENRIELEAYGVQAYHYLNLYYPARLKSVLINDSIAEGERSKILIYQFLDLIMTERRSGLL